MSRSVVERIRRLPIPREVGEVMTTLSRAGARVYLVGGAIRDWVWQEDGFDAGHTDWDLTTDLHPERLRRLAPLTHAGERFGTFRFGAHIEVTAMRNDMGYNDGRRPQAVIWTGNVQRDLARRDFTVNAVAFDGHEILAVDGALEDLEERRIRAVGHPRVRFEEDALRILRLVRLAGNYQALMDGPTWRAAQDLVSLTERVSRERRLREFLRFLESPMAMWPLWADTGLDAALDWPRSTIPQGGGMRFGAAPSHSLARVIAYFLMRYGDQRETLRRWSATWPLPREWRLAVRHLLGRDTLDVDSWQREARWGNYPSTWFYVELAMAAGLAREQLTPMTLALTPRDLAERWGMKGRAVREALDFLRDQVDRQPALNRAESLVWLLNQWQARHEVDS
jgi:tRNA nucleotidyltransferase (CCA-adding enzyme)